MTTPGTLPMLTLADLPEWRRDEILWHYASELDYDGVDDEVRRRSVRSCFPIASVPRIGQRRAMLGDDGRHHLLVDGEVVCARQSGDTGHMHRQYLRWWTDGRRTAALRPPDADGIRDRYIDMEFAWTVTLHGSEIDPGEVMLRHRCVRNGTEREWPPINSTYTPRGRVRAALIAALGPDCHTCRNTPGQFIDHNHFTGIVRGLLCRDCNTRIEKCPHLPGTCPFADYLQNPPGASLQIQYPHMEVTWERTRVRVALTGLDPIPATRQSSATRRRSPGRPRQSLAPQDAAEALDALDAILAKAYRPRRSRGGDGSDT